MRPKLNHNRNSFKEQGCIFPSNSSLLRRLQACRLFGWHGGSTRDFFTAISSRFGLEASTQPQRVRNLTWRGTQLRSLPETENEPSRTFPPRLGGCCPVARRSVVPGGRRGESHVCFARRGDGYFDRHK